MVAILDIITLIPTLSINFISVEGASVIDNNSFNTVIKVKLKRRIFLNKFIYIFFSSKFSLISVDNAANSASMVVYYIDYTSNIIKQRYYGNYNKLTKKYI